MYNGTNSSFVADRSGKANSAVDLNSGYYTAPAGVYFSGDHTVAVWIKVKAFTIWSRVIDFGNGPGIDNIFISVSYSSNYPVSAVYNSSSCNGFLCSNIALKLNNWTHLAHTFSNSTCKMYLNGTLAASIACLAPPAINRSNCFVGKSN